MGLKSYPEAVKVGSRAFLVLLYQRAKGLPPKASPFFLQGIAGAGIRRWSIHQFQE